MKFMSSTDKMNTQTYYIEPTPDEEQWLSSIKKWGSSRNNFEYFKTAEFKNWLSDIYERSANPLRTYVFLMSRLLKINTLNHQTTQVRKIHGMFMGFVWKDPKISSANPNSVPEDVRKDAMRVVFRLQDIPTVLMLNRLCALEELVDDEIIKMLTDQLEQQHFLRVACIVKALDLQGHFEINKIVLPLMATDKSTTAKSLFLSYPQEEQQELLSLLDRLRKSSDEDREKIIGSMSLPLKLCEEAVTRKILKVLRKALPPRFSIKPVSEHLPKVVGCYAIKPYMKLCKMFTQNQMSEECWEDWISEFQTCDSEVQIELIRRMIKCSDPTSGRKLMERFNLSLESLPAEVQEVLRNPELPAACSRKDSLTMADNSNLSIGSSCSETLNESKVKDSESEEPAKIDEPLNAESPPFHSLNLPRNCVKIINTLELFNQLIDNISKMKCVLAMDFKWRAFAGLNTRISVIQLACADTVWLIDVETLTDLLGHQDHWKNFIDVFFTTEATLIGYGVYQYLDLYLWTFPFLDFDVKFLASRFVDLEIIWVQILHKHKDSIPYPSKNMTLDELKSTSAMVQCVLEKPLSKLEQLSLWDRRPLREQQVLYAALDVYCLLEVFQVLGPVAESSEFKIAAEKYKQYKGMSKERYKVIFRPPEKGTPSSEMKVVVDYMLPKVAEHLRAVGVDTVILEGGQNPSELVGICQQQERIVVTFGPRYSQIKHKIPTEMCFSPYSLPESFRLLIKFLERFKVEVKTKDIWSRCKVCNDTRFIKVPKEQIYVLYDNFQKLQEASNNRISRTSVETTVEDSTLEIPENPTEDLLNQNVDDNASEVVLPHLLEFEGGSVDHINLKTDSGASIVFENHDRKFLSNINMLRVCNNCGSLSWEGWSFKKSLQRYKMFLMDADDKSAKTVFSK